MVYLLCPLFLGCPLFICFKLPYLLVGGMKNMRAILVNLNPLDIFCVNVASHVIPFLDHKTGSAFFRHFMGEDAAKKARAHNEIIVMLHDNFLHYIQKQLPGCPKRSTHQISPSSFSFSQSLSIFLPSENSLMS